MEKIGSNKYGCWLEKQSKHGVGWNRRWVQFDGFYVRYYDKQRGVCKGEMKLHAARSITIAPSTWRELVGFIVGNSKVRYAFSIENERGSKFLFSCENQNQRDSCIAILNKSFGSQEMKPKSPEEAEKMRADKMRAYHNKTRTLSW